LVKSSAHIGKHYFDYFVIIFQLFKIESAIGYFLYNGDRDDVDGGLAVKVYVRLVCFDGYNVFVHGFSYTAPLSMVIICFRHKLRPVLEYDVV